MTIQSKSRRAVAQRAREGIKSQDPSEWRPKTEQERLNDLAEFNADIRDTETLIRNLIKDISEASTTEDRAYFAKLLAETEKILEDQKTLRRKCAERAGLQDLYP